MDSLQNGVRSRLFVWLFILVKAPASLEAVRPARQNQNQNQNEIKPNRITEGKASKFLKFRCSAKDGVSRLSRAWCNAQALLCCLVWKGEWKGIQYGVEAIFVSPIAPLSSDFLLHLGMITVTCLEACRIV